MVLTPKANKTQKGVSIRRIWSPTQDILESPCTKLIKERKIRIRTESLLNKFIEVQLSNPKEKNAEAPEDPAEPEAPAEPENELQP